MQPLSVAANVTWQLACEGQQLVLSPLGEDGPA